MCSPTFSETLTIKYDAAPNQYKSTARVNFEIALYEQLPRYATGDQNVNLEASFRPMSPNRALQELSDGTRINVLALPTATHSSTAGMMIPIPIMKGLLGFRKLIIREETAEKLHDISNVAGLRKFSIGQGEGWAETKIYNFNRFPLALGIDINALFNMLLQKRFDLLPLGIVEVDEELRKHPEKSITPYKNTLLYYPLPVTIHVNKQYPGIRSFIESALHQMASDGTIDQLLHMHFSHAINHITDHGGKIISLQNPFIPSAIPLNNATYWLHAAP